MKLGTVTTLLEFLFLTLWPDVFAEYSWREHLEKRCSLSLQLLRLMEDRVQDINEPATKKQRNHPESHRTDAEVSKKELELLTRHLQNIYIAIADTAQTKPWSERYVGKEPNHSSSNFHVILSVQHVKKYKINVLIQSQAWKPFLPSGKAFRLIKQSGVTPQTTLKTSFLLLLMKVVI